MSQSNVKSRADVVEDIQRLIQMVGDITVAADNKFDDAAKSRLIESLQDIAGELNETDPAILSITNALELLKTLETPHNFDTLKADVEALLEKETVTLFPRDLFKARKDLVLFALFWLALGSIPILLVCIGTFFPLVPSEASSVAGTIGDAFGMANAFFSGLALLFVAATMHLQRKELMLQRNELRLTRDEMRRSSDSQAEQASRLEAAARIAALSHIYDHYNTFATTRSGSSPVKLAVASGKKRWAVRHLHMLIEPDEEFRTNRLAEIESEDSKLVGLLRGATIVNAVDLNAVKESSEQLTKIAKSIAALMADQFINPKRRDIMYQLYDVIWDYDAAFSQLSQGSSFTANQKLSEQQLAWIDRFKTTSNALIDQATTT
jgi:hypothetical protein